MKIRTDFVTNSSSSSYIICFARIVDEEKANKIIEKNKEYIRVLDAQGVKDEMYLDELGADWAGAIIYSANDTLKKHPNDKFIIIEDWNDAEYDYDSDEYFYDYCFGADGAIEEITEENGFIDKEVAEGEGRNG